jgi:hypothetical protein
MPYDLVAADDILAGYGSPRYFAGTALAGHGGYDLLAGAEAAAMSAQQGLQQVALNHAMAVVPRAYTKGRKWAQGFGPVAIASGGTANIIVQPQVTFKGDRLVIPSDIAGAILINQILVGQASQLPSANPLPGRMFTEFAVDSVVNFDTAQVSQQIALNVTNTSGATVTFIAGLRGYSAL